MTCNIRWNRHWLLAFLQDFKSFRLGSACLTKFYPCLFTKTTLFLLTTTFLSSNKVKKSRVISIFQYVEKKASCNTCDTMRQNWVSVDYWCLLNSIHKKKIMSWRDQLRSRCTRRKFQIRERIISFLTKTGDVLFKWTSRTRYKKTETSRNFLLCAWWWAHQNLNSTNKYPVPIFNRWR